MSRESRDKVTLPVLDASDALPTGKHHVSFSELTDWIDCSFRHKLKYIDKIALDKPSIHTEYGQAIHDCLENYILGNHVLDESAFKATQEQFKGRCADLREKHGVEVTEEKEKEFSDSIPDILSKVESFMNSTFPGWSGHAAEFSLYENITGTKNKWFKGFIDTVLKVDDYYYIVDWKTSESGWSSSKKNDFNKQMQLVLYRHYFARLNNIDLKKVKCGFVVLKRTYKLSEGPCEFVPVSVSYKKEEEALTILSSMISGVSGRRFVKNRKSCRFCVYSGTRHCP